MIIFSELIAIGSSAETNLCMGQKGHHGAVYSDLEARGCAFTANRPVVLVCSHMTRHPSNLQVTRIDPLY